MARYSSGRWSRPATGRQIAALKANGAYDGKYYSMGRASKAIGTSTSAASRGFTAGGSRSRVPHVPSRSAGPNFESLVADLLGVPESPDAFFDQALRHVEQIPAETPYPVESVVLTFTPDETDAENPRIQVGAVVSRNPDHQGDVEVGVRFVSNVEFGQAPPQPSTAGFQSGVKFDR